MWGCQEDEMQETFINEELLETRPQGTSPFQPIDLSTSEILTSSEFDFLSTASTFTSSTLVDSLELKNAVVHYGDSITTYTIPFVYGNLETFNNLVVSHSPTDSLATVFTYELLNEHYEITNYSIVEHSQIGVDFSDKIASFGGCETVTIVIEQQCTGDGHWPGDSGCTCGTSSECQPADSETYNFTSCGGVGGASPTEGDSGGGNPSNGGGSGGSGSGTHGGGGFSTPISPSDPDCLFPPVGDLNGDCILDAYEECSLVGESWECCPLNNSCIDEDVARQQLAQQLDIDNEYISALTYEKALTLQSYLEDGGSPIAGEIYIDIKHNETPDSINQNLVVDDSFSNFERLDCVFQKMQNTNVMEDFINDFANDDFNVATTLSCKYIYQDPDDPNRLTLDPNGAPIGQLIPGYHIGGEYPNFNSEAVINKVSAEDDDDSAINIAYNIIHELFHGYMYQQYVNAYNENPYDPSFVFFFDGYIVNSFGDDHDQMTYVFRRKVAAALYNFGLNGEAFDSLPLEEKLQLFEDLSKYTWKGLGANNSRNTQAWNNLTATEKTAIESVINSFNDRVTINQNLLTSCDD